ncbi:ABC transporter ATP-binding protein [Streptomyces rugosispiralis]|uniref:ABC transporter ATP-binding protein n=1 Tax=Streptomyces rugosispiralis TaxID=2967341 RepID=A0ABT1V5I6_9ACTN|nr:ABC transporter ATP-binding protein [Streptomyces rugosispiralis]MCQ8192647.1 ABC transporter ATP-binding protein [Streptomyces rugosispiralis]
MTVSPTQTTVPAVRLSGVGKSFGSTHAVRDVTLDIRPNEFFSILGPSGCGKTTLMRMITGFEEPTEGAIELGGVPAGGVPAHKRDLNMLFQSYALFPHLSVHDNVAFELKVRKSHPKQAIAEAVRDALALVRLEGYGDRAISQLSGGQRQRVAIARALIGRPSLLLLDEPLGALDKKLRAEMQLELKKIQREVGVTFVTVTHDQEEALTMSDRIAVMHDGRVVQVGTPEDIYERPATRFVAEFIGTSNFLTGKSDGAVLTVDGLGTVPLPADAFTGEAHLAVRPEHVRISSGDPAPPPERASLPATLQSVVYLGSATRYHLALADGGPFIAETHGTGPAGLTAGGPVLAHWDPQASRLLAE